uniref:Uncharacterized protein n=1 Tax=Arundo donax TaxID=35708 RepID=A0A0A9CL77_ARUDO
MSKGLIARLKQRTIILRKKNYLMKNTNTCNNQLISVHILVHRGENEIWLHMD